MTAFSGTHGFMKGLQVNMMFSEKFNLDPLKGSEQLIFGSKREDIKKLFSTYRMTFKRDDYEVDDYGAFHAYFENGKLCAVEFFEPSEVYFADNQLIGMDFEMCKNLFMQYDEDLRVEYDVGFTSAKLQIGVYAPCEMIETVLIAREGYYK